MMQGSVPVDDADLTTALGARIRQARNSRPADPA